MAENALVDISMHRLFQLMLIDMHDKSNTIFLFAPVIQASNELLNERR